MTVRNALGCGMVLVLIAASTALRAADDRLAIDELVNTFLEEKPYTLGIDIPGILDED